MIMYVTLVYLHSRCRQPCGVPCQPCMEPCPWRCPHYRCTKLCHEQCNRRRCRRPCMTLLKCGHRCIGVCGETCPDKCRVCHHDEVCEVLFGEEDEPDAMFVQLEECRHIIEVTALDRWMDQSQDTTNTVQLTSAETLPQVQDADPAQPALRGHRQQDAAGHRGRETSHHRRREDDRRDEAASQGRSDRPSQSYPTRGYGWTRTHHIAS